MFPIFRAYLCQTLIFISLPLKATRDNLEKSYRPQQVLHSLNIPAHVKIERLESPKTNTIIPPLPSLAQNIS